MTNDAFKAAKVANFVAANLTVGVTVAGVAGALDLSSLTPGNIASGVSIAGITGAYPSAAHPLAGATAADDLPSLASTVPAGTYEWFKADGTRVSGAIADAGTITPGTSAQTFSASVYRQFTVAGDPSLIASNIKDNVSVFGVTGSLSGTPPNCSSNGEVGWVTVSGFKAADLTNLVSGNIKNGVTVAGMAGTYPSLASPLADASGTADLTSMDAATPAGNYEFFDSTGTRYTGTITDAGTITSGTSDVAYNASLYRQFTVAGDADLDAANIKSGANIFGVAGTVTPSPANCSANAEEGCVTTSTYKAADLSNLTAANIKNGVVLAGVTGDYPSATNPLAGADGTTDLPAFASTSGGSTYEWFNSDGSRLTGSIQAYATLTPSAANQTINTGLYRSVTVNGDADLDAANIKSGANIFGIAGNVTPAPANCSANAEEGCVTTATFKAADLSNLTAGNIKNGVVLAGVTGDYPSATNPLAGADGTTDLPAFASTSGGSTYEWFNSDGSRLTGSIQADATLTPSAANQTINTGLYRSVTVNGDADLDAANIKSGANIFGVAGNVTPAPANCSANAEEGCVTTATFKAADLSNLTAGNIKNGVTIAGTEGTYPSLVTPLAGASGTSDLTSMAANAPAGSYEFFDSVGTRYTGSISDA